MKSIKTEEQLNKEELMKALINLYEQYDFYPNEVVKSYIVKLEHDLRCLLNK